MDQELDRALAPLRALHHLHHVDDDVLQLGRLEIDRHLEGALEGHTGARLALVRGEERAQPGRGGRVEPEARPCRRVVGLEDALDERERTAVTGLVPGHAEPEAADLFRARERLHEVDVERHRLLLELDRDLEHLADGGAADARPAGGHRRST